jgi:outer membrane protein TolC
MGEDIEDDVKLEDDLLKTAYDFARDTKKEVLESNYQLKIRSQNINKSTLFYKSAKASHYGSLDAVASYNHFDTLNSYDSKLAGISLSIPLYSGGRVSAEVQQAQIGVQIAKEKELSLQLALEDEINRLLIDIKRYNKTIEAKESQITAAQKTKKVLEARYKEGLTTYIEVLDAIFVELNAKLGLLGTYYSKSVAIDQIEYLKGKI